MVHDFFSIRSGGCAAANCCTLFLTFLFASKNKSDIAPEGRRPDGAISLGQPIISRGMDVDNGWLSPREPGRFYGSSGKPEIIPKIITTILRFLMKNITNIENSEAAKPGSNRLFI